MIDFFRLIGLHNKKEKCLICNKTVTDDASIVNYKYQGGTGQAFICKKCADEMDKTKLDDNCEY